MVPINDYDNMLMVVVAIFCCKFYSSELSIARLLRIGSWKTMHIYDVIQQKNPRFTANQKDWGKALLR